MDLKNLRFKILRVQDPGQLLEYHVPGVWFRRSFPGSLNLKIQALVFKKHSRILKSQHLKIVGVCKPLCFMKMSAQDCCKA